MGAALAILSLALGVISVILGVFAIWLSAVFYRWGNDTMERMRLMTSRVENAVAVLDAHLEGLHSDTFSLMSDTVRDMRSALWSRMEDVSRRDAQQESPDDLEGKLMALRHALVEEISGILRVEQPDRRALDDAVRTTLKRTAEVGASEQLAGARTAIRARLERPDATFGVAAASLMTSVAQDYPFSIVVLAIKQMRQNGELDWSGADLRPSTTISLNRRAPA